MKTFFHSSIRLAPWLCCWVLGTLTAQALVTDNNGGSKNETAPANGAPWNNVGNINGASGVYLKNGWVITAQHVVGNSSQVTIYFNGTAYTSSGTIRTLSNTSGSYSGQLADLVLFNIGSSAPAGASDIDVSTTTPGGYPLEFTMIGYGYHAAGSRATISYSGSVNADGSINPTPGSVTGYYNDGTHAKAWSTNYNAISGSDWSIQVPGLNGFQAFASGFWMNGHSGLGQAALGDSGGAVFIQTAGIWYLAGTINAVGSNYVGQPGNAVLYGDVTYMADMAAYASQINAIIASSPGPDTVNSSDGPLLSPALTLLLALLFLGFGSWQLARQQDCNSSTGP